MIEVFTHGKVPIKSWVGEGLDENTLKQVTNLANLPFVFKHVALMPDAHMGYGMPIGGVIATKGVVIPNAVGVDIGCGMCAVKTPLREWDKEILKEVMSEIRKLIPVGFGKHSKPIGSDQMPSLEEYFPTVIREYDNARKSLGTLGGGNHFIELQAGEDGHLWVMVHSGSRNLGLKVADHHNKVAKKLNEKWFSDVPEKAQLNFLPLDSNEGQLYLSEMTYCVDFAFANRELMMQKILSIFAYKGLFESLHDNVSTINIAHNYAVLENHFGHNVMVHRKGATLARTSTIGVIPGSQGSESFIVRGLGNPESFMSCSHGAGRKLGRKQAKKELFLEDEIEKLEELGVIHTVRREEDLDEAPGAYKDIHSVMKNQEDLAAIMITLKPLAVIKG